MYDLNLTVPQLNSDKYSVERKFALLKNYLYELNEALAVALESKTASVVSHLSEQVASSEKNGNTQTVQLMAQSVKRFEELKDKILQAAREIEKEYTTAIEKSEKEILQTATETFTAKGDFDEYRSSANTLISQNSQELALRAEEQELITANLEAFKKNMNTELSLQADAIVTEVGKSFLTKTESEELEERLVSQITQTTQNITEIFSQNISNLSEDISSVGGAVQTVVESLDVYIRRGELEEGVYGIEIGRSDSEIKARFTNDRLSFLQGSNEVAYISGSNLYITRAEILDYLKIGDTVHGYFTFDITQNGLEVRWSNGN